jgi:hypothetical protein
VVAKSWHRTCVRRSLCRSTCCSRRPKPAPISAPPSLLLFDPAGGLLPPRPRISRAVARSGGQDRPVRAAEGLVLTAASTAATSDARGASRPLAGGLPSTAKGRVPGSRSQRSTESREPQLGTPSISVISCPSIYVILLTASSPCAGSGASRAPPSTANASLEPPARPAQASDAAPQAQLAIPIWLPPSCGVRGRDGRCRPPPAQIRAGPIRALGSYLGCLTAKRTLGQG